MGIPSINSLTNMEYMLYAGRSGLNAKCPSYTNGYMATDTFGNYNYYNPSFYGYPQQSIWGNNYNPSFYGYPSSYGNYQNPSQSYTQTTPSYTSEQQMGSSSTSFQQGITQDDMNKLADYYAKNNALEEGFMGAATGGLSWMAFEHMQTLFHPINGYKGLKAAESVFKNVPKAFAKENSVLMQEAYTALQQASRDTGKQWIRGALRSQINPADMKPLIENLQKAVDAKDVKKIAEATEKLKAARGMDGWLVSIFSKRKTVAERLAEKTAKGEIAKNAANLVDISKGKFGALVKSSFKKDFVGFLVFEAIFSAGKIMTAFGKDSETGLKQTGQSVGKAALGTAGWCLGRAAGTWLGAKAGAVIGSAICPGAGTVAGALIGFTVGSIGMWAGHKIGNWILGKDVADKVEAENMAQTQSGQVQLLQFAAQKAQEGKTDAQTNNILTKALYA